MTAFTEEDVRGILLEQGLSSDLINHIREKYNGYRFSEYSETRVYIPEMVLNAIRYPETITGQFRLNYSLLSDINKFKFVAQSMEGFHLIIETLVNNGTNSSLKEMLTLGDIIADLNGTIPSVLYYFGLLTRGENMALEIPNQAMQRLYEYYLSIFYQDNALNWAFLRNLSEVVKDLTIRGTLDSAIDLFQNAILSTLSNMDTTHMNEELFQLMFKVMLLGSGSVEVFTEHEIRGLRGQGGRADLLIKAKRHRIDWLIEFKYLKPTDVKGLKGLLRKGTPTEEDIRRLPVVASTLENGLVQARGYCEALSSTSEYANRSLKCAVLVCIGKDFIVRQLVG